MISLLYFAYPSMVCNVINQLDTVYSNIWMKYNRSVKRRQICFDFGFVFELNEWNFDKLGKKNIQFSYSMLCAKVPKHFWSDRCFKIVILQLVS